MRWPSMTHTQRWHVYQRTAGTGHLYQGHFKSFPVQSDALFLTVSRYVERTALNANLVERGAGLEMGQRLVALRQGCDGATDPEPMAD